MNMELIGGLICLFATLMAMAGAMCEAVKDAIAGIEAADEDD
jgi:hypothetical protein